MLAFPSVVVRPGVARDCLVVVLPAAILVAWPLGRLRAASGAVLIEKSAIARVELASTSAGGRFASFATFEGPFGSCRVGLPPGAGVFA